MRLGNVLHDWNLLVNSTLLNIKKYYPRKSKSNWMNYIFIAGSVRMFDLRHLEHSTIIYEDPQHTPLLRLAWNKQDPNYLATVAMDSCEVIILDVRVPCTPVARLNNHKACVNGIAWAPHSSCHICTAGNLSYILCYSWVTLGPPIGHTWTTLGTDLGYSNAIHGTDKLWIKTQGGWLSADVLKFHGQISRV